MLKKKRVPGRGVILWMAVCLSSMLFVIILVPGLLVKKISDGDPSSAQTTDYGPNQETVTQQGLMIPVYLTKKSVVETVPLEQYVKGVLAAEMPVEFELEALKAQAMAARTYVVRRVLEKDYSNMPVDDALVTDTTAHQAYLTDQELKEKWGTGSYETNMAKIDRAVNETKDMILTYGHKPINATFFSTSNGYTENSEDYWPFKSPYLRSVPSPWDMKLSSRYQETVDITYKTMLQKLGVTSIATTGTGARSMKVLEWSTGHRIKKMTIGGKTFSGREVREKLGLASSQFAWKWSGSKITFTTYGYGHGVGLSQWGANGMAKEGKTAEQIVTYYYTGISIEKAAPFIPKS
ncbi:stage II sporulation protein D [Paenibacillus aceris]|uniref:Stage II sporulation protein D n=1 Tax=Paenibacillus aceris TaxID=869555 RepID=A0ABS4I4V9_9BACL|nr:stage II sporulation protein D [Paenibacillus aceris]MBP1965765.1 stage II sporulation protein D [Paenibacillus aceris]NHW34894.1 stage II sporulation protein D [Paenibacillus aceris]